MLPDGQRVIGVIDAVLFTRNQMMEFNATPILALESMMVSLKV